MNTDLNNIRIVLVETSHAGNIGAVARAMKNMGLDRLFLVKPKSFPSVEATARAAGADDILQQAEVCSSLADSLAGCHLVIGSSARMRNLPLTLFDPHSGAKEIVKEATQGEVAIVFGRESSGLTNDELMLCHYHLHIPTVDNFSSLNLAAAVLIVIYEVKMAASKQEVVNVESHERLATFDEMSFFYEHLRSTLLALKFFRATQSRKIMYRLQRMFNRARIEKTELNILRGILSTIDALEIKENEKK